LGSLFLAPREGSSRLALEMGLGFFIFRVFCVWLSTSKFSLLWSVFIDKVTWSLLPQFF
jgi:hypothetical protein